MRVIQDSDDESDGDIELQSPQPKIDASSKRLTSNGSAEQSAGSTESLKRAFETAHRAHFQSDQKEPHSSVSLPELDGNITGFSHIPDPRAHFGVEGRVGSARIIATNSPTSLVGRRMGNNPNSEELAPTSEGTWMPDGTLRHDYARHDPSELFPEASFPQPSSTVPNATLTQQRITDVTTAASLGMDNDPDKTHFQPQPSIAWSEFITTSPVDNNREQLSSDQQGHTSEPASGNSLIPELQKTQDIPISQWSQQSLSLVGDAPLLETPTQNKIAQEHLDSGEAASHSQGTISNQEPDQTVTASSKSRGTSQSQRSTQRRQPRKSQKDSVSGFEDDLADPGLPVEQYKPRPSRSRSLKVSNDDDVDYSVRPEKVARASKRRKTTTAPNSSHDHAVSTPQKMQQIYDMGFTPSTAKNALTRNNGDVTQAVDWLIAHQSDELASPNRSRGKSITSTIHDQPTTESDGIRKESVMYAQDSTSGDTGSNPVSEVANGVSTSHDTVNNDLAPSNQDTGPLSTDTRSPVKVQVVIPTKPTEPIPEAPSSLRAPSRKAKRRKTTLDQPEAALGNEDVIKPVPEKKRGRGRPKKTVHTATPTEILQEHVQTQPLKTTSGAVEPDNPDVTLSPELAEADVSLPQEATASAAVSAATPEPPSLPTRPEVSPITPERANKSAKRDQSASGKGKVPYRVGLSKRARIAPLLRTLRK